MNKPRQTSAVMSQDRSGEGTGRFLQAALPVRLGLVLLSGLSLRPLMSVLEWPFNLLVTGGVYGALVLVPFLRVPAFLRLSALVLGGALVHWGATALAIALDGRVPVLVVYASAGLAGALACALMTVLLAPLQGKGKAIALAALGGLLGGAAFAIDGNSDLLIWAAYITWQLLVFLGLHAGRSAR